MIISTGLLEVFVFETVSDNSVRYDIDNIEPSIITIIEGDVILGGLFPVHEKSETETEV